MTPVQMGAIGVVLMLIIMFCRMWTGPSMIFIGFVGCWLLSDWPSAMQVLGTVPYSQTANYTMACLPMFVFMGILLTHSQIGADLYLCMRKWIGHIRGGLAMASVVACGFFAAICGESTVTAITMGKIAYPEMRKYGYSQSLAASCLVCGGTVGILIPPSVSFILYGMITEQSIGQLFMAGVIPGIMQVLFYVIVVFVLCRIKPSVGPAGPQEVFREKVRSLKTVWPVVLLFLFIMYGIYGGLFTATEAGAMGALAALIISIALRRMNKNVFATSVKESLQSTAMVFLLLVGAYIFMRFMSLSGLPTAATDAIITFQQAHNVQPVVIIILIMVVYLILGCFLDALAVALLTIPIIYPIVVSLGYDPIWWGVMFVRYMEISMITPPFGLNLFVMTKAIDTPLRILYKGVWPFIAADIVHVALLIAFPQIALWLPNMM